MKLLQVLCLALFVACSTTAMAQNTVPNVDVKTLDGKSINLEEAYGGENGKVTVVSFWATWCTPCKKELDVIADMYEDWQDDYDVEVIAITIDNSRALAKVPAMVETKGWEYTVLAGNQTEMFNAFGFSSVPQTFVIDKNGNIAYSHSGYIPGDEDELEEIVAELSGK